MIRKINGRFIDEGAAEKFGACDDTGGTTEQWDACFECVGETPGKAIFFVCRTKADLCAENKTDCDS